MKCALELTAIIAEKKEEKARAKLLKEMAEKEARRETTIRFCEKTGAILEAKANRAEDLKYTFYCNQRSKGILLMTFNDYADGRLSFRTSDSKIDIELLKNWFAEYCFKIIIENFDYREYGFGYRNGYKITILPDMQCVNK